MFLVSYLIHNGLFPAECTCNLLGTDAEAGPCNRKTGQCSCRPNVIGLNCDQCRENHWKIASGMGCEACSCDPVGSDAEQCNQVSGQVGNRSIY
jgi:coxsackievirus/adenovirus receptor